MGRGAIGRVRVHRLGDGVVRQDLVKEVTLTRNMDVISKGTHEERMKG